MQISGTVTRKSNGTIEIQPSDAGTFNKLPAMGDEVSLTVEVTRSAAEIEQANAAPGASAAAASPSRPDVVESAPASGVLAPEPRKRRAKR
jgi:hypothetical protein